MRILWARAYLSIYGGVSSRYTQNMYARTRQRVPLSRVLPRIIGSLIQMASLSVTGAEFAMEVNARRENGTIEFSISTSLS